MAVVHLYILSGLCGWVGYGVQSTVSFSLVGPVLERWQHAHYAFGYFGVQAWGPSG